MKGKKYAKIMKEKMKDPAKDKNTSNAQAQTPDTPAIDVEVISEESEPTLENKNSPEAQTVESQSVNGDYATVDEAMKIIADLQVQIRAAKNELEEQKDKVLRLQADFDNFRKRKAKELSDTVRFANQDVLTNLLPVLDNFSRTLDAIEKTDNLAAIKNGISLVDNSMRQQLGKIGLEPIECIGHSFDSEFHEAISSIPIEDESKKGVIIDEVEKGYKYREKVIRFSKVIVGE
ncbi:MAG: nucleotide exchange factor GrpE [Bacteroidia bacterium]|nr:nucleotide exchange factor GrpE [Bacteroidia bacterium]